MKGFPSTADVNKLLADQLMLWKTYDVEKSAILPLVSVFGTNEPIERGHSTLHFEYSYLYIG